MQEIFQGQEVHENLSKLKAAVDSANDAMIIVALGDGVQQSSSIEYVNAAFTRMFGYERTEVIGKPADLLTGRTEDGILVPIFSADLASRVSYRQELVSRIKGGSEFVAEWHVTNLDDDNTGVRHRVAIVRDVRDKHRYEQALRSSEQRALRQLIELETLYHMAPVGLAMLSTDLRYVRVNDRLAQINGVAGKDHIGRTPREVIPDLADQIEPLLLQVLETGQPVLDVELEGPTGSAPAEKRFWRNQFYPVLFDNIIEGIGTVMEEVTEHKRREQHLKMVMQELNHRVKNSLAVIQSIASQTVRTSTSLADFEDALIGRIRALANTHTLLTETNWQSADLCDIVRQTLRLYTGESDRIRVEGPDVALTPSAALAFSMVIHELTTNAVRFGALSSPKGRLHVCWWLTSADDKRQLILQWSETGGPTITEPSRVGFGSQLIAFTIGHEFGGTVRTEYRDEGMFCEINIPWEKVVPADKQSNYAQDFMTHRCD